MPLYEYQCDSCHHRFEVIQKFSDPPIASCPSCGGSVKKLLSSPAIQFKGSGWYITDYARKGDANGKAGEAAETGQKAGEPQKPGTKTAAATDSGTSPAPTGRASSSSGSDPS